MTNPTPSTPLAHESAMGHPTRIEPSTSTRLGAARLLLASLGAAAAVALVAYAGSLIWLLARFVGLGDTFAVLGQVQALYTLPMAVVFVLLIVAFLSGIARHWALALAGSLVVGVVGLIAGQALGVLIAGAQSQTVDLGTAARSLFDVYLPTLLLIVTLTPTLGVAVHRRLIARARREAVDDTRDIALVRVPSKRLADGELTHLERTPVQLALAERQWEDYVSALEDAGFETVEVEPSPEHPDSVFVEDTLVMVGDIAVAGRAGAASREGEADASVQAALELGRTVHQIVAPGTLEGGDVLKTREAIYVGSSSRTNAEGIRQLREILAATGETRPVIAVPVRRALHLKTAVTALPDGTVIGYEPYLDDARVFARFVPVPEAEGAAIIALSSERVLMSAAAPKTRALLEELGYRVTSVDVSEFEKLEGCVTCLSVRVGTPFD